MFEQSILIDHTGARKTGAFAASLTAQILLGGVLLLAPLIYHDALPAVHLNTIVTMRTIARAPDPPSVEPTSTAPRTGPILDRVLRFRFRVPTQDPQPMATTMIENDVPGLPTSTPGVGDFIPLGAATSLIIERPSQPTAPKPTAAPAPAGPVSISGGVQAAKLLKQVVPVYPPMAIRMRVSGTVHLLGIIAKNGTIQKLQVLSGNPLLTQAALDAVGQWVYRPTILSGNAVEVEAPIDVIFTLSR